MSETKQQEATTDVKSDAVVEKTTEAVPTTAPATDAPAATTGDRGPRRRRGGNDRRGGGQGGRRPRRGGRHERVRPEFDQKIVSIRRVTRVMAGGRRFSFSVAVLIGDRKGSVGLGLGKSNDTTMAINKAVAAAKKNMIKVPVNKDMEIGHEVAGKFKASRVMLMPNKGKGLVAGGAIREMMLLAGVKNTTAKIFSRSKNHLNNAKAAMKALKTLAVKAEKVGKEEVKEEKPAKETK